MFKTKRLFTEIPGSTPGDKNLKISSALRCPCGQLNYGFSVHIAAFSSLCPLQLLWVTMVECASSWSYVVLPCGLTLRHPSRSESEMPINGGLPRLFFYSWASQTTYHATQTPRPQGFRIVMKSGQQHACIVWGQG